MIDLVELQALVVKRTVEGGRPILDWSLTDWATAMAGEAGEACNLVKKDRRGEVIEFTDIADEVADMVIYGLLLCERLDERLSDAIVRKFNEVSDRVGSPRKLSSQGESNLPV